MKKWGVLALWLVQHHDEGCGEVVGVTRRTPDDMRETDEAGSEIGVQGACYPEKLEALTGR